MTGTEGAPYVIPGTTASMLEPSDGAPAYRILWAPPREQAPETGFPVLYLLDGGACFCMLVEMLRMRRNRPDVTGVGPAVIVGVSHPDAYPYDRARREWDYTPGPREAGGAGPGESASVETSGGSERFRRFLVEDLIPLVEDSYPCDPGSRTLIGHSLAGLFTVLMLLQAPGTFRNYVSISPSLWWAPKALHRELDLLASRLSPEAPARRVLLAVGEYEQSLAPWHHEREDAEAFALRRADRRMVDGLRAFHARLDAASSGLETRLEVYPEGDHASVVPIALTRALRFVLPA